MHTKTRKFFAVVGIAATGLLWLAVSLGSAARERTRNPYPKMQNGLTFIAAHKAQNQPISNVFDQGAQWLQHKFSGGSAYVVSDTPCLEISAPSAAAVPLTDAVVNHFSATARASNGDTFALRCQDFMPGSTSFATSGHFFVSLTQPGVPDQYQWVDVTVKDKKSGNSGTWRMFDLPRLKHAVSPTAPLHEAETVQKVPLEARAWWNAKGTPTSIQGDVSSEALPVVAEVRSVVPQAALALPSYAWVVSIDGLTQEWEPASRPLPFVRGKNSTSGYSMGSSGYSVSGNNVIVTNASAQAASAPYPAAQTRVKIDATLTLRDAHDESVTFRDIPLEPYGKGLRVRAGSGGIVLNTPSGVRVRLFAGSFSSFDNPPGLSDVDIVASVSPEDGIVPGSPLQKRAGKHPLHISWHIPFDGDELSSMQSDSKAVRLTYKKRLPRPVLPTLTVNVSQTTELKTYPVQFTVPVQAGKPKKNWEY